MLHEEFQLYGVPLSWVILCVGTPPMLCGEMVHPHYVVSFPPCLVLWSPYHAACGYCIHAEGTILVAPESYSCYCAWVTLVKLCGVP